MKFPTLYGKNSSGKLKIWEVFTEGNSITVRHGLLSCRLENGIEFDCLMRKDSDSTTDYRLAENSASLVGKWITFQYEGLSDSGVSRKPVGTGIRRMDNN